jgi:hypothetical protein
MQQHELIHALEACHSYYMSKLKIFKKAALLASRGLLGSLTSSAPQTLP